MFPPKRIVSLLPSSAEICFTLGLGDSVIGVSHECDYPPGVSGPPVLTSLEVNPHATPAEIDRQVRALVIDGLRVHRVDAERLRGLRPDLINHAGRGRGLRGLLHRRGEAARLPGAEMTILSLSPLTLADVLDDIVRIRRAAGVRDAANRLVADLRARLGRLRAALGGTPARGRTRVLAWLSPPMIAGHRTPELVHIAGGEPPR